MTGGTAKLLRDERTVRPAVVELARALSLAARLDVALIRAMRLEIAPRSDPGVETDLWFSPLVQVRSRDAMALMPAVVEALRAELTRESTKATARRAWKVIARVHGIPDEDDGFAHAAVTPVLALEERLVYLATLGTPDALARADLLLGRAVASVRDRQDRGMARWAVRTLPRLPESLRHSGAALALAHVAGGLIGGIPVRGVVAASDATSAWTAGLLASLPRVDVGMRAVAGGIELSEPPSPHASVIRVPATPPLLLNAGVPVANGWRSERWSVTRGVSEVVPAPVGPALRIATIDDAQYRFLPRFDGDLRAMWLLERGGRTSETERVLREAGRDLGWDVQRFAEGVGSPHAVVVWRFGEIALLERLLERRGALSYLRRQLPRCADAGRMGSKATPTPHSPRRGPGPRRRRAARAACDERSAGCRSFPRGPRLPSACRREGAAAASRAGRGLAAGGAARRGGADRAGETSPPIAVAEWPAGYRARYALEHVLDGLIVWRAAALALSWKFLQQLIEARGYSAALHQLERLDQEVRAQTGSGPDSSLIDIVRDYGGVLSRNATALEGIAHDHLLREGRTKDEIATAFDIHPSRLPLRLVYCFDAGHEQYSRFFDGHTDRVTAIAAVYRVSTREATAPAVVVSGDRSGVLMAWNLENHRALWREAHHRSPVSAIAIQEWAFGPQALRRGMSADAAGHVVVWDLATGRAVAELAPDGSPVSACAISNNGRWILSASINGSLSVGEVVWRDRTTAPRIERVDMGNLERLSSDVCAAAFVGDTVVLALFDGRIVRRAIADGTTPPAITRFPVRIESCAIDRATGAVTARLEDGQIAVIGPDGRGPETIAVERDGDVHRSALIALEPATVAFGQGEGVVVVSRGPTGARRTLRGHHGTVRALAAEHVAVSTETAANDRTQVLVSGSDDHTLLVWNPADGLPVARFGQFGRAWRLIDVDEGERAAVFPIERHTLALFDLRRRARVALAPQFGAPITACRFLGSSTEEATRLAVGLLDGQVLVGDGRLDRFDSVHRFSSPVTSLHSLRRGSVLVAGSDTGGSAVVTFDGRVSHEANIGHQIDAPDLVTIGDGAFVGCEVHGGELGYWDATGRLQRTLRISGARIGALATAESRWLAAGLVDGAVLVWDLMDGTDVPRSADASGREVARLGSGVSACAAAPDRYSITAGHLLCGLNDGTIVVLELSSGRVIGTLDRHTQAINGLAVFDWRYVLSWSRDGSLCVWDLPSLQVVGTVYSRAPFIDARWGASGRIYAFDALGQPWLIEAVGIGATLA